LIQQHIEIAAENNNCPIDTQLITTAIKVLPDLLDMAEKYLEQNRRKPSVRSALEMLLEDD